MIRIGLMKIIMWAIVPIALTLIFFVTVDSHQSGGWVNLLFVWLAYLTASATCVFSFKRLTVLDWTVYMCAFGYFAIEIFFAIAFLYLYQDVPQWAFTTQLLLFVAFVLLAGCLYISDQKTEAQMESQRSKENVVKQWKLKVDLAKGNVLSEDLSQLFDLLQVTPSRSIEETKEIEHEISLLMENLPNETGKIIKKIKERNLIIKKY